MSSLDHKFDTNYEDFDLDAFDSQASGVRHAERSRWLRGFSVRGKLNLAVFGNTAVLAALALIILGGTWMLGQGGQAQAIIASVEVRTNNAAIALVETVDAIEAAQEARSEEARSAEIERAQAALATAHSDLSDPIAFAGDDMPADIGPVVVGFRDSVAALQSEIEAGNGSARALAQQRDTAQQLYDEISGFAIEFHAVASSRADALFASITNFLISFVIITAIGIIVSLLSARHIIRDVTGTVHRLTGSMQRVAGGAIDTAIPGSERADELGEMARSLGVFRSSMLELRDLNKDRAKQAEDQLAQQREMSEETRKLRLEKSQLLEGMANGFEVSVGELINAVSAASVQLKSTSQQMVALADGSNEQANGASKAMSHATANVTAAAAATDEFALSIGEISRQASASASLARDASNLVSTANTRMHELSSAADEIGEIIELIQTIAQRTNLLALNASIEAARGGEAGRGFAVVASEVKELAMQTSNATSSVTEKITAMQDSSRSSAGDLNSIVDQIGELEKAAVMIASAVDQQSVSGDELARNIDTVASGSAQVGDRLAELRKASEETGTAADDVVASADALGHHAEELRTKAGRFIADVRRSAQDFEMSEQEIARTA